VKTWKEDTYGLRKKAWKEEWKGRMLQNAVVKEELIKVA